MTNSNLTPFRREVLQFIIEFRTKHAYSPSLREIARGLGYHKAETMMSSVKNAIGELVEQGYLTSVGLIARSYIPTGKEIANE